MDNESKREERKAIATVSRVLASGVLVELLYNAGNGKTALAVASADGSTTKESVDLGCELSRNTEQV